MRRWAANRRDRRPHWWRAGVSCSFLSSCSTGAVPGSGRGEEKKTEQVRITGINRMWGDTEGERTYLEGDLVITKGDTVIYASFAEVEKTGEGDRARTATAQGRGTLVPG